MTRLIDEFNRLRILSALELLKYNRILSEKELNDAWQRLERLETRR